jgi:cold shock protein
LDLNNIGVVKWFNDKRGFGFLAIEGRSDLFVHRYQLRNVQTLAKGDMVQFRSVVPDRRRPGQVRAFDVFLARPADGDD